MNKRNTLRILGGFFSLVLILSSCTSDDSSGSDEFPLSADIFHSIKGKRVAFQALTHGATSYQWDFGDGTTSTEKNPVHNYPGAGFYTAVLTATGGDSGTITDEVLLALEITPYVLLTGGASAVDGKTWKISSGHSDSDYFANADAELSPFDGAPNPLPPGIFGAGLGMSEVYEDEFTFYFDGSYSHDVKADNAAFSGLVFQFVTTGGAGIVNDGGEDFGLCTGLYEPEAGATFTYVENENFTISSVEPGGMITYENVSTLDFSGTEFVGFYDFENKVIIQDLTSTSMRLVMFLAASPEAIGINSNAIVLTFEVVQ